MGKARWTSLAAMTTGPMWVAWRTIVSSRDLSRMPPPPPGPCGWDVAKDNNPVVFDPRAFHYLSQEP